MMSLVSHRIHSMNRSQSEDSLCRSLEKLDCSNPCELDKEIDDLICTMRAETFSRHARNFEMIIKKYENEEESDIIDIRTLTVVKDVGTIRKLKVKKYGLHADLCKRTKKEKETLKKLKMKVHEWCMQTGIYEDELDFSACKRGAFVTIPRVERPALPPSISETEKESESETDKSDSQGNFTASSATNTESSSESDEEDMNDTFTLSSECLDDVDKNDRTFTASSTSENKAQGEFGVCISNNAREKQRRINDRTFISFKFPRFYDKPSSFVSLRKGFNLCGKKAKSPSRVSQKQPKLRGLHKSLSSSSDEEDDFETNNKGITSYCNGRLGKQLVWDGSKVVSDGTRDNINRIRNGTFMSLALSRFYKRPSSFVTLPIINTEMSEMNEPLTTWKSHIPSGTQSDCSTDSSNATSDEEDSKSNDETIVLSTSNKDNANIMEDYDISVTSFTQVTENMRNTTFTSCATSESTEVLEYSDEWQSSENSSSDGEDELEDTVIYTGSASPSKSMSPDSSSESYKEKSDILQKTSADISLRNDLSPENERQEEAMDRTVLISKDSSHFSDTTILISSDDYNGARASDDVTMSVDTYSRQMDTTVVINSQYKSPKKGESHQAEIVGLEKAEHLQSMSSELNKTFNRKFCWRQKNFFRNQLRCKESPKSSFVTLKQPDSLQERKLKARSSSCSFSFEHKDRKEDRPTELGRTCSSQIPNDVAGLSPLSSTPTGMESRRRYSRDRLDSPQLSKGFFKEELEKYCSTSPNSHNGKNGLKTEDSQNESFKSCTPTKKLNPALNMDHISNETFCLSPKSPSLREIGFSLKFRKVASGQSINIQGETSDVCLALDSSSGKTSTQVEPKPLEDVSSSRIPFQSKNSIEGTRISFSSQNEIISKMNSDKKTRFVTLGLMDGIQVKSNSELLPKSTINGGEKFSQNGRTERTTELDSKFQSCPSERNHGKRPIFPPRAQFKRRLSFSESSPNKKCVIDK